uniref:Dual oxidase maturation factor 1 n=1 Tax=Globodera pallida TaxID=36090 RepID=A0A183CAA5_GLOPA
MSIGWFDAFRENGAPTWYGENPTPVVLDLQIAGLLSLFLTPTIAFLLILPGIRRFRALSAFIFLFSMGTGAIILLSIYYPGWNSGNIRIFATYRAHSNERINALLGVRIGLSHVNITLNSESLSPEEILLRRTFLDTREQDRGKKDPDRAMSLLLFCTDTPSSNSSSNRTVNSSEGLPQPLVPSRSTPETIREGEEPEQKSELYYNERFDFDDVSGMEVNEWLEKGLPYPILQVVEYLSVDRTGFLWGKQYRLAGYYTHAALWLAFAIWILQIILLGALPHRFGLVAFVCGLAILFADFVYLCLTPDDLFLVFFGPDERSHRLTFHPASCFYATFGAGLTSTAVGAVLWFLEQRTAFRLTTVFSACIDELSRPHKSPGAASRFRFLLWSTVPSASLRRRASLSTRWGSFTSLGHVDQTVGWKRRRRTLRREPRELDVYELQRRAGLRKVKSASSRRWSFLNRTTSPCSGASSPGLPSGSISPSPSDIVEDGMSPEAEENALNEAIAANSHSTTTTVAGGSSSSASGYCSNVSGASAGTRLSALTEPEDPSAPFDPPPPTPHPRGSSSLLPRSHPPMFTFDQNPAEEIGTDDQ